MQNTVPESTANLSLAVSGGVSNDLYVELSALTDDQLRERGELWLRQQQEKGMVSWHLSTVAGPAAPGGREVLIDLLCSEAASEAGEVLEFPVATSELPPHILELILSVKLSPAELLNPFSSIHDELSDQQTSALLDLWLRRRLQQGEHAAYLKSRLGQTLPAQLTEPWKTPVSIDPEASAKCVD